MAGPTLDDITDSACANGTFYKCLPYGTCYNFQGYCSNRSKTVNSCFPHNLIADDGRLLDWCQKEINNNVTSLVHPSCKYACMDRFNASALYQCPSSQSGNSADYSWVYPVVLVLAILLLVSGVGNVVLTILLCKRRKGQHPMEVEDVENRLPGDENNVPKDTNKEGVNGHTAAPPVEDARENDITNHRPTLDRNQTPRIHSDQVQDRSLDTHSGAPLNHHDHDQGGSPDTLNVVTRNQRNPVQGRNSQSVAPRNQHEQDHARNRNIQNGAPRNQDEHDHGINSQSGSPTMQHDPLQRRSTNTENGALMNQRNPSHGRNSQSRTPVSQHEAPQGRSTQSRTPVSQHEAPQGRSTQVNQLEHDQSTRNNQDDQDSYHREPRASVISHSSVSFRRASGGTSEEQFALLPRSDASLFRGQTQRDLSANFSPQIPEAEGRHVVVTNLSVLEGERD